MRKLPVILLYIYLLNLLNSVRVTPVWSEATYIEVSYFGGVRA